MAVTVEVLLAGGREPAPRRAPEEAYAELYSRTFRPLVSHCRRLLCGMGDPEEVAQEAFARAWQSWDNYAPSRPFWPWVATIARRLCIDYRRHLDIATGVLHARGGELTSQRGPSPEEAVESAEERALVLAAFGQLKPAQQRIVSLRDIDGWSYEDIAEFEGVTVESIRASLRRARGRLREVYARVSAGAPAVVVLNWLRRARHKVSLWASQASELASSTGVAGVRAADALATMVVLTVAAAGGPSGGPPPTLLQVVGQDAASMTTGSGPVGTGPSHAGVSGITTDGVYGLDPSGASASAASAGPAAGPVGARAPHSEASGGPLALPGAPSVGAPSQHVTPPMQPSSSPEQATYTQFQPSPNYQKDHTVFASGVSYENCASGCPVLFRSDDSGRTWTLLGASGFQGGTIMLPPSYPADSRIFVAGPNALQVSTDNGQNFTALTSLGGPAAMSPGFSSGDPRILVGAAPGWVYHDDTKAVTPLDLAPLPASQTLTFAFSPSYPADHRLLVGTWSQASGDPQGTQVSVCQDSTCSPGAPLAGAYGPPGLVLSPSFASDGAAFAWQGAKLYRSTDGGTTFTPLALPATGIVNGASLGNSGDLYMALLDVHGASSTGGVFSTRDGSGWRHLGKGTTLDSGAETVASLLGGRILAAPHVRGAGLLCSADGGGSWTSRC